MCVNFPFVLKLKEEEVGDDEEEEEEEIDDDVSSSIGDLGISVEDEDATNGSSSRDADDSEDNFSDIDSGNEDDGDVSGSSEASELRQKSVSPTNKSVDLNQCE